MNIAAPFKQLVERRLWPLAALLIAALVAVPMLLARDPDAPVTPPATNTAGAKTQSALATQPIVTVGDDATRDAKRNVLGARKDPFKPQIKAKKAKSAAATTVTVTTGGAQSSSGGGTSTTTTTTVPAPSFPLSPVAPTVPKRTYELYSLTVRWGNTASNDMRTRRVNRLKALPSAAEPAVIYLGLLEDGKTAVFLVDHDATVQGDGRCLPSPADCQTLHMQIGDIAFIDAGAGESTTGQQYQLELVKIKKKRTTDAGALSATAEGGREALRARMGRIGRLRYDASTGKLKQLSAKAHKAEMARASAR